jgi:hypothetical protein
VSVVGPEGGVSWVELGVVVDVNSGLLGVVLSGGWGLEEVLAVWFFSVLLVCEVDMCSEPELGLEFFAEFASFLLSAQPNAKYSLKKQD